MAGQFHLTGAVRQIIKDGADAGLDQDITALTGWTATLKCNVPANQAIPDGDNIDYVDQRTITLLSDGSITEDGTNAGIYLLAHDPALFDTQVQWTIIPSSVPLSSGNTIRPKRWTFNAGLNGEEITLGDVTPVTPIGAVVLRGPKGDPGTGGGGGATNLAATLSATQTVITSDTGTDATIPAVNATNAGVMTPTMKGTLDGAVQTSGLAESVQDIVGTMAVPGANVSVNYDDTAGTLTISATGGGGSGDPSTSTHAATSKTTPVDADEIPLVDSAASFGLKKLTWASLKSAIKSYYDSVVSAVTNKDLTSGTNTFPTFNQSTTGSAATLTTSRTVQTNLASISSASFNGSANITPGVTGTLPVGNGGTGAATLTGMLKGNGASAFTAATAGTDYVSPSGLTTALADVPHMLVFNVTWPDRPADTRPAIFSGGATATDAPTDADKRVGDIWIPAS